MRATSCSPMLVLGVLDEVFGNRLVSRQRGGVDMAMQHPSISDRDDYLDLYDDKGNWRNQIVIVFEKGVTPPEERTKPIEVKGPVGYIDLGGPKGTKGE